MEEFQLWSGVEENDPALATLDGDRASSYSTWCKLVPLPLPLPLFLYIYYDLGFPILGHMGDIILHFFFFTYRTWILVNNFYIVETCVNFIMGYLYFMKWLETYNIK